ncbi:MAG: HAMP domain-containing histidine kinase [Desulfobacterales bacterium]|nr:HAMP domain-containing histidine kinase [Desulfobacterales bacterium]
MKPFSSLFAKILLWFFLNLALVGAALAIFFTFQSQVDLHSLLGWQTTDRLRIAGRLIAHDLEQTPMNDWAEVLARHAEIHQVAFVLAHQDAGLFKSREMEIPPVVGKKVRFALRRKWPPRGPDGRQWSPGTPGRDDDAHGPPRWMKKEKRGMGRHKHAPRPRMILHTNNPSRYWAGIRIRLGRSEFPAMLLAVSDSVTGNGFFFDPVPWLIVAAAVLLISVLLWIPLVRNITRPLARMTRAAEEIARGKFDVNIEEGRADEIGRLGGAINHMTSRLGGFIKGQKRFLGDVAHELGSPIARIQLGLGILEQRVDEGARERVEGVMEDVEHMSNLVNELLSFSRAEMNPAKVKLAPAEVLPAARRAVRREGVEGTEILTRIDPGIRVTADPELLVRALANLIRNAVRYAGETGPITISASEKRDAVEIEVRDAGPGVPEDLLHQLFEPFFRPELSRDRDSGGVGLGLAIVKTCVETCNGSVSARNLDAGGFAVTISLDPA